MYYINHKNYSVDIVVKLYFEDFCFVLLRNTHPLRKVLLIRFVITTLAICIGMYVYSEFVYSSTTTCVIRWWNKIKIETIKHSDIV